MVFSSGYQWQNKSAPSFLVLLSHDPRTKSHERHGWPSYPNTSPVVFRAHSGGRQGHRTKQRNLRAEKTSHFPKEQKKIAEPSETNRYDLIATPS